jgi:hypothetical protein
VRGKSGNGNAIPAEKSQKQKRLLKQLASYNNPPKHMSKHVVNIDFSDENSRITGELRPTSRNVTTPTKEVNVA